MGIELLTATLQEVVDALDNGDTTSVALVEQYLDRIERDNHAGLGLRAVLETAPRDKLLDQARALDSTRKTNKLSVLHGVPILIKDTISTLPDMVMKTTGGTYALCENVPTKNASLVDRLLAAGVIILGKASLTVLGNFYTIGMANGWSPLGGQVVSPYDASLDPSGSSTGSAVGLAAGFCAAAIGGETDGSIVMPARCAALYALRPGTELFPLDGIMPISHRLDSIGPMGKSAWDVAAMLQVMTPSSSPDGDPIYLEAVRRPKISGPKLRLGVPRAHSVLTQPDHRALFEETVHLLGSSSTISISQDPANIDGVEKLWHATGPGTMDTPYSNTIMETDMYRGFNEYLHGTRGPIRTLDDLVEWNSKHPDLAFHPDCPPGNGQVLLELACATKGVAGDEYREAIEVFDSVAQSVTDTMNEYDLDALIMPPPKTATIASTGVFPLCTIPYKLDSKGHPYGVMILARKGGEQTLLKIMAACEALFPPRPVPRSLRQA